MKNFGSALLEIVVIVNLWNVLARHCHKSISLRFYATKIALFFLKIPFNFRLWIQQKTQTNVKVVMVQNLLKYRKCDIVCVTKFKSLKLFSVIHHEWYFLVWSAVISYCIYWERKVIWVMTLVFFLMFS